MIVWKTNLQWLSCLDKIAPMIVALASTTRLIFRTKLAEESHEFPMDYTASHMFLNM